MPHPRDPNWQFATDVGVHPRLGHAQSDLSNQLALIFTKWLQLDEQGVGHRALGAELDKRSAGGARVGVHHINCGDGGTQY